MSMLRIDLAPSADAFWPFTAVSDDRFWHISVIGELTSFVCLTRVKADVLVIMFDDCK